MAANAKVSIYVHKSHFADFLLKKHLANPSHHGVPVMWIYYQHIQHKQPFVLHLLGVKA